MIKKIDTTILTTIIMLTIIGLIMIFSAAGKNYFIRQTIWLGTGLLFLLLFCQVTPRFWSNFAPIVYGLSILSLIFILVHHSGYPRRWITFNSISIQPSEFAKFATIIMLASYLSTKKSLKKFPDILVPLFIIAIPMFLIFIEPDLGASQIFFPILLLMLYWSGMPGAKLFIFFSPIISAAASFSIYIWVAYMIFLVVFLYFHKQLYDLIYGLITNLLAGLMMPVIWNSLKTYQQKRIISFFSPWLDPRGMSWQVIQSKIAIGSGRIYGKGFLSGTQKKLAFLPERHTDFIFSCLGEEFGFLGIAITIILYIYLFYKLLNLARETKNRFSSLFVIGVFAWLSYQTFLNIGMTMGLIPVTGVPLPFISYGGSALFAGLMAIGLCLAISKHKMIY